MRNFHTLRQQLDLTEQELLEKLNADDPTGKWVSDFVHSNDPKFAGKSKKERIKMALGAAYAAKRKTGVNEQMHRVNVTVSEPDHTMVSKRKDRVQKIVAVRADGRDHAMSKATQYYKDRGYKVHGQEYIGLKEEVEELDEMDKSQPSSSRGAEGLPLGKKADPVKTDKVKSDALKALQKQYKKPENFSMKEQFAIMHKVAKKILSTHDDEASAKDEWKGLDPSERPFYTVVKTNKQPNDFSMKEQSVAEDAVNESSYNDDDNYAIHPETGKVMGSWSKRDSRVDAIRTQQHKEKGHTVTSGRKLNYAEYAKVKNKGIEEEVWDEPKPTKSAGNALSPTQLARARARAARAGRRYPNLIDNMWASQQNENAYSPEYDGEGDMARSDLRSIMINAQEVHDMLQYNTNLPEWLQSKIVLCEAYMSSVRNYMLTQEPNDVDDQDYKY